MVGGRLNTTDIGSHSAILGGIENTAIGAYSSIVGGDGNIVSQNCNYSFIGGGRNNTLSGITSTIVGGCGNTTLEGLSGILGGAGNIVSHQCSFIVGNNISTSCPNTTYVNCLSIVNLPSSSAGLPSGSVYYCATDSNRMYFVP